MKRFIPVVVVALAVTMFWYRDLWLPQPAGRASYLGYVEGETILIGAPVAGRVVSRPVERGALVAAGTSCLLAGSRGGGGRSVAR